MTPGEETVHGIPPEHMLHRTHLPEQDNGDAGQ
jgi:hypothetical protein